MSVFRLDAEPPAVRDARVITMEAPDPRQASDGRLVIPTSRFGELRVPPAELFTMAEGMHGFPGLTQYLLLAPKDSEGLFYWWQAAGDPEVAFPCLDVLTRFPDYRILASEADVLRLGLQHRTSLQVLVVVTVPPHAPRDLTANLLGPLVLDGQTREAWQLICERSDHRVDTPLCDPG